MTRHERLAQWVANVSTHWAHLSKPKAVVLALWSFGMVMTQSCGLTTVAAFLASLLGQKENSVRQRLREWYCAASDKKGTHRQELDVTTCFAPLLRWVLSWWPAYKKRLALAMEASTLGQRFVVLAIRIVYRGCAIPVAWQLVAATDPKAWKPQWLALFDHLQDSVPADYTVIVLTDRGLYAAWLYEWIIKLHWCPFLRINSGGKFRSEGATTFQPLTTAAPTVGSAWCGRVTCFKSHPLACTLLVR